MRSAYLYNYEKYGGTIKNAAERIGVSTLFLFLIEDVRIMATTKEAAGLAKELLERKETGSGPIPPRALDHLGLAVLVDEDVEVSDALAALSRLRRAFVDWNEVRVARTQEIARVIGAIPSAESAAKSLREEYNAFFEKKGALNYEFLAAGKPAETRRALGQLLPKLSKGALAILLYEFCPGASLPLSDEGLRQARRDGVVGKTGDRNQVTRALAEQMDLAEAALLLQHWEIEATGSPYGETLKKDTPKKAKKASAKGKPVKK